jgi:hypothetical protein
MRHCSDKFEEKTSQTLQEGYPNKGGIYLCRWVAPTVAEWGRGGALGTEMQGLQNRRAYEQSEAGLQTLQEFLVNTGYRRVGKREAKQQLWAQ